MEPSDDETSEEEVEEEKGKDHSKLPEVRATYHGYTWPNMW